MAAIFPLPHEPTDDRRDDYDVGRRVDRRPQRSLVVLDGGLVDPRHGTARVRRGAVVRRAVRRRAITVVAAGCVLIGAVAGLAVVFSFLDAASRPPVAASTTGVSGDVLHGVGTADGSVVVVQEGDTLTAIARRIQPSGDIGPLVDRLAAEHGPAPLQPGERVEVGSSIRGGERG